MRRDVLAILLFALVAGLAGVGRGYVDGDAAAYCAQAWQGDLGQRVVHVGYVSLATALSAFGQRLPTALDVVNVLAAVAAIAAVARRTDSVLPVAVFAAVILPLAPFAEVDVPWVALALWAPLASPWVASLLAAAAVLVSPVALLAVPWAFLDARERRPSSAVALVAGAVLAVLVVTVVSSGGWWVADRGVLRGPPLDLHASLRSFATLLRPEVAGPVLAALIADRRRVLQDVRWLPACLPLLLAPADVPAWLVPAAVLAVATSSASSGAAARVVRGVAVLVVLLGVLREVSAVSVVAGEDALLRDTVAAMGPRDGLVAPWTFGARASVIATGDPYGLDWRVPGEPVRDQAAFCARPHDRIAWWVNTGGPGAHHVDWLRGEDPKVRALPGCR